MTETLVVLGWIMGSVAFVALIAYGAVKGQMRAEARRRDRQAGREDE